MADTPLVDFPPVEGAAPPVEAAVPVVIANDDDEIESMWIAARDSARKILSKLAPSENAAIIASTSTADDIKRAQLRAERQAKEAAEEAAADAEEEDAAGALKEIKADIKHLRAVLLGGSLEGRNLKLLRDAMDAVRAAKQNGNGDAR